MRGYFSTVCINCGELELWGWNRHHTFPLKSGCGRYRPGKRANVIPMGVMVLWDEFYE